MKAIYILLVVLLYSCAPKGPLMEYTYQIDVKEGFDSAKQELLKTQITKRLNKYGFTDSTLTIEDDKLIVVSRVDVSSSEQTLNFKSVFEANTVEFWNTFRTTDFDFENIAADLDAIEDFTFIGGDLSRNSHGVIEMLGICSKESKLNEVLNQVSSIAHEIDNLKLFWSKNPIDLEYELYMIDSQGDENAPINQDDIEKAIVVENEYYPGKNEINLEFKKQSISKWSRMTENAVNQGNRSIAIIVNDKVYSCPSVRTPILGGKAVISGDFILNEIESLARSLALGSLNFDLELLKVNEIANQ